MRALAEGVLRAYRWQYILTGAKHHFRKVLGELIGEKQARRIRRW